MNGWIAWIFTWSIFGRQPARLVVTARNMPEASALERVLKAFIKHGAVIEQRDETSFECTLPVRKLLGIAYRRKLILRLRIETRAGAGWLETNVVLVCDLEHIRKAKRFDFYSLAFLLFLLYLGLFLKGDRNLTTWLLLGIIPLAIAQGNFLAARERLRGKLRRLLEADAREA